VPKIEISFIAHIFVCEYFSSGTFFKNSMVETPLRLSPFSPSSSYSSRNSNPTAAVSFVIGDEIGQSLLTTSTAKGYILKAPPPCQSIPNNDCNDIEINGNKNAI